MQYAYLNSTIRMKRLALIVALALLTVMPAKAQIFAIQTNALDYAALGTLNLQAQVSFAQNYSVFIDGRWNPWTFGTSENPLQLGQRKLSAGVRFWPWYVYSGWWVAASFQWSALDVRGLFKQPEIHARGGLGGGVSFGYSFMLAPHLNLDLGAGVCYTRYTSFVAGNDPDTKGTQSFFQPDFLSASIVYVF